MSTKQLQWAAMALLMAILAGCGEKLKWKEFSAPDGSFTVLLPGMPKDETRSQGGLTVRSFTAEVANGAYLVSYTDLPPGTPFDYAAGVSAMTQRYEGKVLSQGEFTLEGVQGKTYEIEINKPKGFASGRMVVVNNRLYQVLAIGAKIRASDPDVQTFSNSLRITGQQAAVDSGTKTTMPSVAPGSNAQAGGSVVDTISGPPPFAVDKKLLGPNQVVFLADMQEFDARPGPWPIGKGNVGNPERKAIVVKGKTYPKGVGMHPPKAPSFARARYALGKRAAVLKTGVAFNDHDVPGVSPVAFLILGDGKLIWQSKPVKERQRIEEAEVDVSQVEVLELRVQAEKGTWGSHAVWLEPRVFKTRDAAAKDTP